MDAGEVAAFAPWATVWLECAVTAASLRAWTNPAERMDVGAVVESVRAAPATTGCAVIVALRIVQEKNVVTMDVVGAAVRVQVYAPMEFVGERKVAAFLSATERNAVMMDAGVHAGHVKRPSCVWQECAAALLSAPSTGVETMAVEAPAEPVVRTRFVNPTMRELPPVNSSRGKVAGKRPKNARMDTVAHSMMPWTI